MRKHASALEEAISGEDLSALNRWKIDCTLAQKYERAEPSFPDLTREDLVWRMRDREQRKRHRNLACALKVHAGDRC